MILNLGSDDFQEFMILLDNNLHILTDPDGQ